MFDIDDDLVVRSRPIGRDARPVLCRSPQMEQLVRATMETLRTDCVHGDDVYEGMIYLMYRLDGPTAVPLYIGKANTIGVNGGLSANLSEVATTRRFARWGDGYAYHIGDLSAAVFSHPRRAQPKYRAWATALFVPGSAQLREPVYFWCKPWPRGGIGLYERMPTTLRNLEYQLIGLAAQLFPNDLLNREGA